MVFTYHQNCWNYETFCMSKTVTYSWFSMNYLEDCSWPRSGVQGTSCYSPVVSQFSLKCGKIRGDGENVDQKRLPEWMRRTRAFQTSLFPNQTKVSLKKTKTKTIRAMIHPRKFGHGSQGVSYSYFIGHAWYTVQLNLSALNQLEIWYCWSLNYLWVLIILVQVWFNVSAISVLLISYM